MLEVLREESTLSEIENKYGVSQQLVSRWKTEFIENMPNVFDKKKEEINKLKKEHEKEREELEKKVGELTMELEWLKKKEPMILEMKKKRNS